MPKPILYLIDGSSQMYRAYHAPIRTLEGTLLRNAQGVPKAWISRRLGGDQIDYADERPEIRKWFSEALAKNGLKPNMDKAYSAEQEKAA